MGDLDDIGINSSDDEYDEKVLHADAATAAAPARPNVVAAAPAAALPGAADEEIGPPRGDASSGSNSKLPSVPVSSAWAADVVHVSTAVGQGTRGTSGASTSTSAAVVAAAAAAAAASSSTGSSPTSFANDARMEEREPAAAEQARRVTASTTSSTGGRNGPFPAERPNQARANGEGEEDDASNASTETEASSGGEANKNGVRTTIDSTTCTSAGGSREEGGRFQMTEEPRQLFSDSDDSSAEQVPPQQQEPRPTQQQPPPPPPPPPPESEQRSISMQIGTAAIAALQRELGRADAIEEVVGTVRGLMPHLNERQAESVARATVDALMATTQTSKIDANGGAAATSPPDAPASAPAASSSSAPPPPAAAAAAAAARKVPFEPAQTVVNRPSFLQDTRPASASGRATDDAETQANANKAAAQKPRPRTAFMNKTILVGPELYDPDGHLSNNNSNLCLPPDQVVAVGSGPSRVEKLRGVITGVPRPSKEKDWFDVSWCIKDRNVLKVLASKIPATPRNRELLRDALVEGNDKTPADEQQVAKQSEARGVGKISTSTSASASAATGPATSTSTVATTDSAAASRSTAAGEKMQPPSSRMSVVQEATSTTTESSNTGGMPPREEVIKGKIASTRVPEPASTKVQESKTTKASDERSSVAAASSTDEDEDSSDNKCDVVEGKQSAPLQKSANKKSIYSGTKSKDSPNEYEEYVKHGRPSQPSDTKMTSPQLLGFLFDSHAIPMLIRGGWNISRKARRIDKSKAASSDVVVSSTVHKDHLYVPPGVEAKAPYKCRVDYFDSKKNFMNHLERNDGDPLCAYAKAFYDALERIVKKEKKASPKSSSPFNDMASRMNSKADKKAMKVLKRKGLSLPPGVKSVGSVSVQSAAADLSKKGGVGVGSSPASSSASDDEVLASLRTKKPADKTSKGKGKSLSKSKGGPVSISTKRVVFSDSSDGDDGDDDDRALSSYRSKKVGGKISTTTASSGEQPIFHDTDSSSDEVLSLHRKTKEKAKGTKTSEQPVSFLEGKGSATEAPPEGKKFKGIRKLPKYVEGTTVKIFPSSKVVRESIVAPIIEDYRGSRSTRAIEASDDEILKVSIVDDKDDSDQVQCEAQGIKELESQLMGRLEEWINSRKDFVLDEVKMSEIADESSDEEESAVDCHYQIGQVIEKVC